MLFFLFKKKKKRPFVVQLLKILSLSLNGFPVTDTQDLPLLFKIFDPQAQTRNGNAVKGQCLYKYPNPNWSLFSLSIRNVKPGASSLSDTFPFCFVLHFGSQTRCFYIPPFFDFSGPYLSPFFQFIYFWRWVMILLAAKHTRIWFQLLFWTKASSTEFSIYCLLIKQGERISQFLFYYIYALS